MLIKAIAFDLDGTLYPDRFMYMRSLPLFLRYPFFIYTYNRMRKEIRSLESIDNIKLKQAEIVSSKLKITVSSARALIEDVIYRKWPRYFVGIKPFPHVRETIGLFKSRGLKLGILSDYPIGLKLKYLDLEDLWDYCESSETVNHLKPHAEPFNHMKTMLGVSPEQILYVGDRYSIDIVGAKRVGMKAAHFTKKKIPGSIADITFSDYKQFYDLVIKKYI
jgi:putative hydrolase of the HAD superfamily